jgi:hypothetical protein
MIAKKLQVAIESQLLKFNVIGCYGMPMFTIEVTNAMERR